MSKNKNGQHIDNKGIIRRYKDGKLHRSDEPSVIYPDGTKIWFFNGLLHREGGSAVEGSDDYKEWWIHGEKYTESEFNNYIVKKELNESLQNGLNHKNIKLQAKL